MKAGGARGPTRSPRGGNESMNEQWAAVLLAGVYDWGSCSLNQARLRPLAPIANRPVIEHVLRALGSVQVTRAVICTNGHRAQLRNVLGETYAEMVQLQYRDDTMPRGPAGCVKDATSDLGERQVVVIESSMVPCFDLAELLGHHLDSGSALTVATQRTEVSGEPSDRPVGMYVFSPQVLPYIPDQGFCDIKEGLIPKLHHAGLRVDAHPISGHAPRLCGIDSYFALNEWAVKLAGGGAWDLDGYMVKGSAMIHLDAQVDESARILGPVIVGPEAIVRSGAIIVGPTSVDRQCIVGEGSVVSRSAVWPGAVIGARAQLDRCIIADRGRVKADARLFNAIHLAAPDGKARRNRATVESVHHVDGQHDHCAPDALRLGVAPGN